MTIIINCKTLDDSSVPEWAIVELQGLIQMKKEKTSAATVVGDLNYTSKNGQPILVLGHHILNGKEVKLEQPIAVIEKIQIEDKTEYKEESERGLPECSGRQACSVLLRRYWRPAALLRLCRCGRRQRCPDAAQSDHHSLELNNRAHFKFCQPVDNWPQCSFGAASMTIDKSSENYEQLDPDKLEELHHQNIQLVPPKITFNCRCNEPNYWKLDTTNNDRRIHIFKCHYLPTCNSGEFCGNFHYDLHSLYQSCLCPKHHICVHGGGVAYTNITELLHQGKGRRAYCQTVGDDDSNDDYY